MVCVDVRQHLKKKMAYVSRFGLAVNKVVSGSVVYTDHVLPALADQPFNDLLSAAWSPAVAGCLH